MTIDPDKTSEGIEAAAQERRVDTHGDDEDRDCHEPDAVVDQADEEPKGEASMNARPPEQQGARH